jgi:SpoVK/Ycf46/Vps4 family AAA+-type ATPase
VRATALRASPVGGHNGNTLSGAAYFRACRMESNQNLLRFGRKIDPSYEWHDVVLPPDTRSQLHEICACVRHKRRVVEGWGFGAKFSVGKGLVVLFAGASGTGKTMCAEIIGGDLQLDVYKIDLSCVVSKYIGETERNLSRIFDEAETSNSILFFDEADALFGKRTEVKDAHDRYANIEINYLLQKLDDYEGIVILATNLRGNLDKAFTRRLNYLVDFPFPNEHDRERIWTRVFPNETPLREDIRLDFLARKFKLAGGNIKNIAVNSAYLAADNGGRVGMEQVILATKREYQKLGRLCSKSEFGPYFNLVQEQQP